MIKLNFCTRPAAYEINGSDVSYNVPKKTIFKQKGKELN